MTFLIWKSEKVRKMQALDIKIGLIGAGNMATAIVKGVLKEGMIGKDNIYVSDLDEKKCEDMKSLGVSVTTDNTEVVKCSDIIILAVKPNIYPNVLEKISHIAKVSNKVFVSIAPGISIDSIKSFFIDDVKVVRTMPNTPALVGEGMTVASYKAPVMPQDFEKVARILACIGKVEVIEEKYMNQVVALNGSSPAYVYVMIEAMADAAVLQGIPRDTAYKLAAQSVLGAAKMVLDTGEHPALLKDKVCSPGGTTIEAIYSLEKNGFRAALMQAMDKCTQKAMALGGIKKEG